MGWGCWRDRYLGRELEEQVGGWGSCGSGGGRDGFGEDINRRGERI